MPQIEKLLRESGCDYYIFHGKELYLSYKLKNGGIVTGKAVGKRPYDSEEIEDLIRVARQEVIKLLQNKISA